LPLARWANTDKIRNEIIQLICSMLWQKYNIIRHPYHYLYLVSSKQSGRSATQSQPTEPLVFIYYNRYNNISMAYQKRADVG
jgi:hypothetical protein